MGITSKKFKMGRPLASRMKETSDCFEYPARCGQKNLDNIIDGESENLKNVTVFFKRILVTLRVAENKLFFHVKFIFVDVSEQDMVKFYIPCPSQ